MCCENYFLRAGEAGELSVRIGDLKMSIGAKVVMNVAGLDSKGLICLNAGSLYDPLDSCKV